MKKLTTFIYFARILASKERYIKIGVSSNVINRIRQIRGNTPYDVKLLGTMPGDLKKERELHELFANLRAQGEWFFEDGTILEYIKNNANIHKAKSVPSNPVILLTPTERRSIDAIYAWIKDFEG